MFKQNFPQTTVHLSQSQTLKTYGGRCTSKVSFFLSQKLT